MKTSNKYLCSCLLCKTELYSCGLKAHYNSAQCKQGSTFVKKWKQNSNRSLYCNFCSFVGKNANSIAQHEIRCSLNKNKVDLSHVNNGQSFRKYREQIINGDIKHFNQFSKAKSLGLDKPEVSVSTRKKLSTQTSIQNKIRWSDPKNIENHKIKMRQVVEANPESYLCGNGGRVKRILHEGQYFHGKWELDFYLWCKKNNIHCERNKKSFDYFWNGNRKYFPDFYLPDYDLYIEIKGYKTDRDDAKWKYFPHQLKVLYKKDIMEIREGNYKI